MPQIFDVTANARYKRNELDFFLFVGMVNMK